MKLRGSAILILLFLVLSARPVFADISDKKDSDQDGISDYDEINIYKTDPYKKDTDGDGYEDWLELNKGYSPSVNKPLKLEESDFDGDGLNDRLELKFHSDLKNKDTNGNGVVDGKEVELGYDPARPDKTKLEKIIKIDKVNQVLTYFLNEVKMGEYKVSTGVKNYTPKGEYKIVNKSPKAWSPYGLWMPWWMGLGSGKFGIHELPIWPNGYREGENHLGKAVSHGCVRLGVGPAKKLYDWAEVGTKVIIN